MKVNLSSSARNTQELWATQKNGFNSTQNQSFIDDKRVTSSYSYRKVSHVEEELGRTYDGLVSTKIVILFIMIQMLCK